MKWLNFLHFYQPIDQQPDILEAVVNQSYLPVFKYISESKRGSLSVNISGALLELLDKCGHKDLLTLMQKCVKQGKIELTGSCMYHSFIPLLPENEIVRQIRLNESAVKKYFDGYRPAGFFPPEMGYSPNLPGILAELGYKWLVIDEIAYNKGLTYPKYDKLYKIPGSDLRVFFRNRRLSNLVMSAVARDIDTIVSSLGDAAEKPYIVTGMDGETFGHHRPGLESLVKDLVSYDKEFQTTSISDFLFKENSTLGTEEVEPFASTWASSFKDIEENIQFLSWFDPSNEIHKYQWEFFKLCLAVFNRIPESDLNYEQTRHSMDIAVASDHFWWASAKPWWSVEMIEQGAYRMLSFIQSATISTEEELSRARELYQKIVSTAFEWQRNGKVRAMSREQSESVRIPFKERTFERGGHQRGVWEAFMHLLREQERVASKAGEYEKAILWRDAIFKLENKLDIYDTLNAIDLLRIEIGNDIVEKTIDKYTAKYREIRGGQPEQRG